MVTLKCQKKSILIISLMFSEDKVTEIFCMADDFCKFFDAKMKKYTLPKTTKRTYHFKLHLICNEKGELLNFMITPGDVDDRKPLEYRSFVELNSSVTRDILAKTCSIGCLLTAYN